VQNLGISKKHLKENSLNMQKPEAPLYPVEDLNGIIPVDH